MTRATNPNAYGDEVISLVRRYADPEYVVRVEAMECGTEKEARRQRFVLYGYFNAVRRFKGEALGLWRPEIDKRAVEMFQLRYALVVRGTKLVYEPRTNFAGNQAIKKFLEQLEVKDRVERAENAELKRKMDAMRAGTALGSDVKPPTKEELEKMNSTPVLDWVKNLGKGEQTIEPSAETAVVASEVPGTGKYVYDTDDGDEKNGTGDGS